MTNTTKHSFRQSHVDECEDCKDVCAWIDEMAEARNHIEREEPKS